MRFIGGKTLLIPDILEAIYKKTENVKSVADLFSGSGVVTRELKRAGYNTVSNDLMYFSYVLLRGTSDLHRIPEFHNLKKIGIDKPIEYLNQLSIEKTDYKEETLFIYNNYSPRGNRMYFTEENAIKIDIVRKKIEEWKNENLILEDEYFYLLAVLLEAVPYISNIAGVYGAFLKFWDDRSKNNLLLEDLEVVNNGTTNITYNTDANELAKEVKIDLAYLDPPYNHRQYLPNYHVLETIAKYDNPEVKGVTGLRDYSEQKSDYCRKADVYDAFNSLIYKINAKYILLSYNTEGLLTHEEIIDVLEKYGKQETLDYKYIDYQRYKNAHTNKNKNLKEILYFVEKK